MFASFAEHSRYSSAWQFHLHCLALIAGGLPQLVDIVFVLLTYVEEVAQCFSTLPLVSLTLLYIEISLSKIILFSLVMWLWVILAIIL